MLLYTDNDKTSPCASIECWQLLTRGQTRNQGNINQNASSMNLLTIRNETMEVSRKSVSHVTAVSKFPVHPSRTVMPGHGAMFHAIRDMR